MNWYDENGHRKYLNPAERDAFLSAADVKEPAQRYLPTAIYADAMGPEKRQLVERMWG